VLSGGPLGLMQAAMDLVLPYCASAGSSTGRSAASGSCRPRSPTCTPRCSPRAPSPTAWPRTTTPGTSRASTRPACLLHASDAAVRSAGGIQALGGNGYINEYPAGRILRDAKLYAIGAGTNEIRRMLIGRELFGATPEPGPPFAALQHAGP
jgi:isovaleryl-CoA dehydrogenase